ncbi:unnamed protein product [Didymodactylos carnosus]|uniref:Uncharacterized protein n=1 Tax=Didymodactylos carnosus TaxID=1234261 RepID=A0A8S2EZW0_9BILA|nr:unnamed protein product [Didymodactylos carnosus]CAF4168676.1 unnamed protein product [Didymodactylos carnosus]
MVECFRLYKLRKRYVESLSRIREIYRKKQYEGDFDPWAELMGPKLSKMDYKTISSLLEDAFIKILPLLSQLDGIVSEFLEDSLKSLKFLEKAQPPNYEEILRTHKNIGRAYSVMKDDSWACKHYVKALEIGELYIPNDINQIRELMETLGNSCLLNNDHENAFKIFMKKMNIDEKMKYLTDKQKQAQCYFDMGEHLLKTDPDNTLKYTKMSLYIRQKTLKIDDVNIGFCHQYIGAAYEVKDIFDLAVDHYKKAIEVYKKHLSDKEEYQFNVKELYGECHSKIAFIHQKRNDIDKSIKYHQISLRIYETYLPDNINDIETISKALGMAYLFRSDHDNAFVFFMKAININKKTCQLLDNEKEAQCYYNMGIELFEKDPDNALTLLKKSLEIQQRILKSDDAKIGLCHHDIGWAFQKKSSFDSALGRSS